MQTRGSIVLMEQSLEQQHRTIHQSVRQRLDETAGMGKPQVVPPYLQLSADVLQNIHTSEPVGPDMTKAARILLGHEEDTSDLPPFLKDLLAGAREKTITQLLHYYTTHKVLQAVAAQRVREGFPDA